MTDGYVVLGEARTRVQGDGRNHFQGGVQKDGLTLLDLIEIVVFIETKERGSIRQGEETEIVSVEKMILHRRVGTLAPEVKTRQPAERAGVVRGETNFLRKVVGAREVRVRVVETGRDRQSTVVAFRVPAAVVEAGHRR